MRQSILNLRLLVRIFSAIILFWLVLSYCNCLWAEKTGEVQVLEKAKKRGFVKIATIGPSPLPVNTNTAPQKVVEQMIAHWKDKFAQVLPDRPDLIVVPEACDRPSGFSLKKRLQYYQVRKK